MLKNFLNTLVLVLIAAYLIIVPLYVFPKIEARGNVINNVQEIKFSGVLDLWHIESFEGGSASRGAWLNRQAILFEKENPGVFIMVKTLTEEMAIANLQNGVIPSLISFGVGVGESVVSYLTEFDKSTNVRDDLLKGGYVNNSLKAVPFILGGYSIITNSEIMENNNIQSEQLVENIFKIKQSSKTALTFGAGEYNNPAKAFNTNFSVNAGGAKNTIDEEVLDKTSYDAYADYLSKKSASLLGTQRDVYRIKNRESLGTIWDNKYTYLSGYSDLVQYMGVVNKGEETNNASKSFVRFITSKSIQQKLTEVGMFSVLNKSIYSSGYYRQFETALLKPINTPNVFLHKENINETQKQETEKMLKG